MPNSSFYVIGKRGHGVVFLRMDPLRVSRVSHQTILAYEAQNAGVDGYARIAAAARVLFAESDGNPETSLSQVESEGIYQAIKQGSTISDVDFAFLTDVDDSDWDLNRLSWAPIQDPVSKTGSGSDSGNPDTLQDAVLSDD
ncbi:hypothetical protein B0E33_26755 [Roseibium algicola]|jgi:hypothetical protein|uniref:Uncharacterized protein n=2 Tax=Hyphomicrobiales TaxID=356 RepID=A0ABM6I8H2_9HYPH|nr:MULTISPECIES: hypothetical protein [Stappiaceae]AMN53508.1 hypothetical protein ACP90_14925 [Labrenzia sp. CP4]AQQ06735.1 hypothetical protein B0E33_26755 [Roseibium aggregatum]QFS99932.1 hypothetical protein FIV06_21065 [Labrenzia sp. THAF191b]QFT06246.1 hypothetical protein FIV05_21060 [Labrenzia sp. THAF191a]QFT17790.1 hypothetical protein FIV03_21075 [Labrenzia sp. THAF187b]